MNTRTRRLLAAPVLVAAAAGAFLLNPLAALAATTGTVRVGDSLYLRTTPSTAAAPVGRLYDRDRVAIDCRVSGQYVRGRVRRTAQWDRLTSGRYVSHAFVRTSTAVPPCPTAPARPEPTPVVGPAAAMTQAQFIAAAVAPAQRSQRSYRVPASVTIAQAILESGWGRSQLAARDHNFFGMRCYNRGALAVGCRAYATTECRADGTCYPTDESFRTYDSVFDSFCDHGRLLSTAARYRPALAYVQDPDRFVEAIRQAGYATSPTYATDLQRVMREYDLYRYDLR